MVDKAQTYLAQLAARFGLDGGEASSAKVTITAIDTKSGEQVTPLEYGVSIIVGPNNAGKSTLLREISSTIDAEPGRPNQGFFMVSHLTLKTEGTLADACAVIISHNPNAGHGDRLIHPPDSNSGYDPLYLFQHSLEPIWDRAQFDGNLGEVLGPYFKLYANTDTRLNLSHPAPVRDDATFSPQHPIHYLADDRTRLDRANRYSELVFGTSLTLDDYSASNRIRVGKPSTPAPRRDEVDTSYRDEVLSLPELNNQGDGMRSLIGLLLPLLSADRGIILVDEPEAFLHPPQAAALGRILGELADKNRLQVILATHDRNLLQGVLDSSTAVKIIRLNGKDGPPRQIQPDELEAIWKEPSLRYTNALDSIFHKVAILVEGDRDARFYSAILEANKTDRNGRLSPSDVVFIPCGGKGGMAKLARVLRGLGVAVVAMPDLDILSDEGDIKRLVSAFGGDWLPLSRQYAQATASVSADANTLLVRDLMPRLERDKEMPINGDIAADIRRFLRSAESPWKRVKAGGIEALGVGSVRSAAHQLVSLLDALGIIVVKAGELESLAEDVTVKKGPNWVPSALDSGAHETDKSRDQMRRVEEFVLQTQLHT